MAWKNILREKQRYLTQRLMRIPPIQLVVRAVQELLDDDGTHMAAGVAYYAFLSVFPLLLGVLAIATLFFSEEVVRQRILSLVQAGLPAAQNVISQNIRNVYQFRGILGIASVLGLFWTASAMFAAISSAINRAWDVKEQRPFYVAKARQLLMAVSVVLLLGLSLALGAVSSFVGQAEQAVAQASPLLASTIFSIISWSLSFAISFIVFALLYRLVPNTGVAWTEVWAGALVAAVGFEVAKWAFVFYLNNFANYGQIYGSLASIVILLVWMYFSAVILIFGAELTSEYARMRRGLEKGTPLAEALAEAERKREWQEVRR